MSVVGWEDPNLKPTSEKLLTWARNNFVRNPYLHRMFDPRAKGMMQHIPMATYLQAEEQALTYKRKYHNEFYFNDFFSSNKWRLLLLNFGEFFGVKHNLLNHELKSFSKKFFKGPLQGYLLNTAAYTGIYGHAGYQAGKSDEKFLTFMITTVFSGLAFSPVQYLAYKNWNTYNRQFEAPKDTMVEQGVPGNRKPLFMRSGSVIYQRFFSFLPASMMFTSLYGLSIYLNNCANPVLNALYYPSLVLSYGSLSFCGLLLRHLESESNFLKLRYFNLKFPSNFNWHGLGLFVALNSLFPITIEQLRDRNEFKHAYLEFVKDSEVFLPKERLYA